MAEYSKAKGGKLVLKGEKVKKHKSKKRKHRDEDDDGPSIERIEETDTSKYGGWWKTQAVHQIQGSIAIQMGNNAVYISALDDGTFTVGPPHNDGEGPNPEEIFTAVPTGDKSKVALKSGYSKYLGVDSKGRVVARSEAIGPREMWTPIYQDGQTALLSSTDCFMGVDDDDNIVAVKSTVGTYEILNIRCNTLRAKDKTSEIPTEEKGSLKDIELNYVKKFQKFQDKKLRINSEGYVELKDAKNQGKLHEALLDRRSKMKADRYCK